MATTMYFEETVTDQGGKNSFDIELGRSSYYSQKVLPNGGGGDSIYLVVDGKSVIMDRIMAKKFVEAVAAVGRYHSFID